MGLSTPEQPVSKIDNEAKTPSFGDKLFSAFENRYPITNMLVGGGQPEQDTGIIEMNAKPKQGGMASTILKLLAGA